MRLDLPTLDRPEKAISSPSIGGSEASEAAAWKNCQSEANSFRPAPISSAVKAAARSFIAELPGGFPDCAALHPGYKESRGEHVARMERSVIRGFGAAYSYTFAFAFTNTPFRLSHS